MICNLKLFIPIAFKFEFDKFTFYDECFKKRYFRGLNNNKSLKHV